MLAPLPSYSVAILFVAGADHEATVINARLDDEMFPIAKMYLPFTTVNILAAPLYPTAYPIRVFIKF